MPAQTPKALRAIGFTRSCYMPYRCLSRECREKMAVNQALRRVIFYMHSPLDGCPNCGQDEYLYPLAMVHLILPEKKGIIIGKDLADGRVIASGERLEFYCESARQGYRKRHTDPKNPTIPKHFTNRVESATCYDCLKAYNRIEHPRKIVTTF